MVPLDFFQDSKDLFSKNYFFFDFDTKKFRHPTFWITNLMKDLILVD